MAIKKIAVITIIFITIIIIIFQKLNSKPDNTIDYVAKIEDLGIKRADYQKDLEYQKHFNEWLNKNSASSSAGRSDVLEEAINQAIIALYAREHNIVVSDQDISGRYNLAVKSVGTEEEYLKKLADIRGWDKNKILDNMKNEILIEKVIQQVQIPLEQFLSQHKLKLKIQRY